MIRIVIISGTTDGAGAADVTGNDLVSGILRGIQGNVSALDAGADTTITWTSTPGTNAITILTLTNVIIDFYTMPTPGAVTTAYAAVTDAYPFFAIMGKPRVVIASGGATKAFDFIFYIDDLKP